MSLSFLTSDDRFSRNVVCDVVLLEATPILVFLNKSNLVQRPEVIIVRDFRKYAAFVNIILSNTK
jgi:hypothetical protein